MGKAAATGLALGAAIDWLLVPHRELIEDPPVRRRNAKPRATVVPLVSAERGGAMFGAAAVF